MRLLKKIFLFIFINDLICQVIDLFLFKGLCVQWIHRYRKEHD